MELRELLSSGWVEWLGAARVVPDVDVACATGEGRLLDYVMGPGGHIGSLSFSQLAARRGNWQ
eukprot:4949732-Prorocentrum_lima.AAC.1